MKMLYILYHHFKVQTNTLSSQRHSDQLVGGGATRMLCTEHSSLVIMMSLRCLN